MKFYDYRKTNSYTNCRVFFILGGRTIGKTYGFRKSDIADYLKHGWTFLQLVRSASDLARFERGFFSRLESNREFPGWRFNIEGDIAYIDKEREKSETGDWRVLGYFGALSKEGIAKDFTFDSVRNITLDEAVIDRRRHPRIKYLPDEYVTLAGWVSTALRETPDNPLPVARVRLLGNACDLTCPYFEALGIDKVPDYGRHFYNRGRTMLHRVPPVESEGFREKTTVGQMLGDSMEADMFFDNEFTGFNLSYICEMPKDARLSSVLRFNRDYGIYLSLKRNIMFVSDKIPKDTGNAGLFALTRDDMTIDYPVIRRNHDYLRSISKYSDAGLIRYDSAQTMGRFSHVLDYLGCK